MKYETKMNIFNEKLKEYLKANKKEKTKILDSVCNVTNISRKRAIKNFRKTQLKDSASFKETRGRKKIYNNEVICLLSQIWKLSYRTSGELLYPILNEYLDSFKKQREYVYSKEAETLLLKMSLGTVKGAIAKFRKKEGSKKKGFSATKPSQLKRIIPVFFGSWKNKEVGHGQLDTVALCGSSLRGDFMWALNFVDIATYWTVFRFQWSKGQEATVLALAEVIDRLPFKIKGVHPDNGSEFINYLLKGYCDKHMIEMTRSRAGKKNDNFAVEERNGHLIRKFIGYPRLDKRELLDDFNILADKIVLFNNHFKAVRRTIQKDKVNSKYLRKFDEAKTPYQRVLDNPNVPKKLKDKLRLEHDNIDLLSLKKEIDIMRGRLLEENRCDR